MATTNPWQRSSARLSDAEWRDRASRRQALPGKRIFDLVLSVTGLLLGLPLMAMAAAAVGLGSSGAVFVRIRCWGAGARPFEQLRLRVEGADGKMSRTGRVVAWLRLDALPQLVNVLRGEMSLVGPAPVPAGDCAEARVRHLRRFEAKPGMTGMWALGSPDECAPGRYFSPEASYSTEWSAWRDLAIVVRALWPTPPSAS